MRIDEALKIYGSGYNLCKILGISSQNFTRWRRQGFIPEVHQLKIEKLTNGELKADEFGPDRRPLKQ